jgi:hypothetical protein
VFIKLNLLNGNFPEMRVFPSLQAWVKKYFSTTGFLLIRLGSSTYTTSHCRLPTPSPDLQEKSQFGENPQTIKAALFMQTTDRVNKTSLL